MTMKWGTASSKKIWTSKRILQPLPLPKKSIWPDLWRTWPWRKMRKSNVISSWISAITLISRLRGRDLEREDDCKWFFISFWFIMKR
jgi:hypothetical protein